MIKLNRRRRSMVWSNRGTVPAFTF